MRNTTLASVCGRGFTVHFLPLFSLLALFALPRWILLSYVTANGGARGNDPYEFCYSGFPFFLFRWNDQG